MSVNRLRKGGIVQIEFLPPDAAGAYSDGWLDPWAQVLDDHGRVLPLGGVKPLVIPSFESTPVQFRQCFYVQCDPLWRWAKLYTITSVFLPAMQGKAVEAEVRTYNPEKAEIHLHASEYDRHLREAGGAFGTLEKAISQRNDRFRDIACRAQEDSFRTLLSEIVTDVQTSILPNLNGLPSWGAEAARVVVHGLAGRNLLRTSLRDEYPQILQSIAWLSPVRGDQSDNGDRRERGLAPRRGRRRR